jgi:hypothetical protein
MKRSVRRVLRQAVGVGLLVLPAAWAQVPPHVPGTICFTPQFWCWVPTPGQAGAPCSCPSPYGWVRGQLG